MPSSFTVSGPPGADGATGATGPGFLTDAQANRPAAAAAGSGAVFIPSDGYPPARSTGAAWVVQHPLGFACSNPPAAGDLTKVGTQAENTLVADGDGLLMTSTGVNGTGTYGSAWSTALPGGAYSFVVGIDILTLTPQANNNVGIFLSNGTATTDEFLPFLVNQGDTTGVPGFVIQKYSALNTWNSTYYTTKIHGVFNRVFLRIRDNTTTRTYDFSLDGRNWNYLYSVGRTDYATPTHGGVWIQQATAAVGVAYTAAQARIFHWSLA